MYVCMYLSVRSGSKLSNKTKTKQNKKDNVKMTYTGKINNQRQMSGLLALSMYVHASIESLVCPSICFNEVNNKGHHMTCSCRQINLKDNFSNKDIPE